MSKYTTELRFICENYSGLSVSEPYTSVSSIIDRAIPKIFDFDFPIFDENYRAGLCKKILLHYYTREIGMETVGLWKLKLYMKMNEIMPLYNQLYKSELIEFNPLYDTDLTTTNNNKREQHTVSSEDENGEITNISNTNDNGKSTTSADGRTTSTSTATGNTNSDATNLTAYSETPQGNLQHVAELDYLTNATRVTGNETGNSRQEYSGDESKQDNTTVNTENSSSVNSEQSSTNNKHGTVNINGLDEYIQHVIGKTSGISYSKLLTEFRETFMNIDMMVIDELNVLFMGVY